MSRKRHARLEQLFHRALDLPADQVSPFLDEACGDDTELRKEIEELLFQDSQDVDPTVPPQSDTPPPDRIGPYLIGEKLGEGGFAEVFMAQQEGPLKRTVAVKILKSGVDTRATLERFSLERQSLAVMNHEGIARIHDAGTTEDGRPYFVMEFVDGQSITRFSRDKKLGTTERLDLFAAVCDAVNHAHQKGVIHRDLKPSNILVTEVEGDPRVKVIDFGIAKVIETDRPTNRMFTRQGQFIGTPEYMSPEQAGFGPGDLDTRTDIYSLGVVLYELLAGVPPFSQDTLAQAGFAEVQRIVREVEPPRPSTRVSQQSNVQPLTRRDFKALRGELDWVVLKAMEKDRERRYHSSADLADELRRYLADEPLTARPPSPRYRLGKFIKRHRTLVVMGVALLVGMVGLTSGVTIALLETRKQTQLTEAALAEAEAVTGFLTDMISAAQPYEEGKDVTVMAVLDSTAATLDRDLGGRPLVATRVRRTLGTAYTELGRFTSAEPLLDRAFRDHEKLLGPLHEQTLVSLDELADLSLRQDRNDEAEPLFKELHHRSVEVHGSDHPQAVSALHQRAIALMEMSRYEEAEPLLVESWTRGQEVYAPDSRQLLAFASNLANFYGEIGKHQLAEPYLRRVLDTRIKLLGPEHPEVLEAWNNLAMVFADQGHYHKAIPPLSRALKLQELHLGPGHFEALVTRHNLAAMQGLVFAWDAAESLRTEGVELAREHREPGERIFQFHLHSLGFLYLEMGRWDEAKNLLTEAYELRLEHRGPDHRDTFVSLHGLGMLALYQGDTARADSLLKANLDARFELLGESHAHTLGARMALGQVRMEQARWAEGNLLLEKTYLLAKADLGLSHRTTLETAAHWGRGLLRQEDWSAVENLVGPLVALADSALAGEDPLRGALRLDLAASFMGQGRPEEARPLLAEARALLLEEKIKASPWNQELALWSHRLDEAQD